MHFSLIAVSVRLLFSFLATSLYPMYERVISLYPIYGRSVRSGRSSMTYENARTQNKRKDVTKSTVIRKSIRHMEFFEY